MDAHEATVTAEQIQRRWANREAPDGDFIVFADGTLIGMRLDCPAPLDRGGPCRWTERLRATAWSVTHWLDVDATLSTYAHDGSRAWGGESANHGSIGWVALTGDDTGRTLRWLAVCETSNPFAHVWLDDEAVTAVSTAGRVWTFPRADPQRVRITADPDYPRRREG